MAITRLGGANAISGTIPAANVATLTSSNLPSGTVVQTVSSGEATQSTINSTSYVLAISLAITPSTSSNKIYIKFDGQYMQDDSDGASSHTKLTKTISATETTIFDTFTGRDFSGGAISWSPNFGYLDSPNTTSEVTYKIYGRTTNSSSDWRIREQTILNAFEIKG